MDIKEALNALNGFFDCLAASGYLTDEEIEEMTNVEDVINNYVHSKGDI